MTLSLQESANLMQKIDMYEIHRKYGATGVMIGSKPDGRQALVFTVPKKLSQDEIQSSPVEKIPDVMFPESLITGSLAFAGRESGDPLPTDVVEEQFQALYLKMPMPTQEMHAAFAEASRTNPWQSCHNAPIPGGVQIQPNGADWVGTAGCAVRYIPESGPRKGVESVGVLTNYHVASMGKYQPGSLISQPLWNGSAKSVCARIVKAPDPRSTRIVPSGMVDCALLSAHPGAYETGGDLQRLYGDKATFAPQQLTGNAKNPVDPRPRFLNNIYAGVKVWKSGRTTYLTSGQIAGLGNFTVGYGNFSVTFKNQLAIKPIRNSDGPFSSPGDSGSLILDSANRPVALLFAGGPQHTIATPIEYVMRELNFTFLPQA